MTERMVPLRTVDATFRVLSGHGLIRLAPEVLRVMDPTHTAVGVAADLAAVLDPVHATSLIAPLLAVWESDRIARRMVTRRARKSGSVELKPREAEVLAGMADGHTNAAIGKALRLSEDTVKTYAASLFRKLGARDRAHAVRIGYDQGLLASADTGRTVERLVRDVAAIG